MVFLVCLWALALAYEEKGKSFCSAGACDNKYACKSNDIYIQVMVH